MDFKLPFIGRVTLARKTAAGGDTATRQKLLGSIAEASKSVDWRGFLGRLPNPDKILRERGLDISAYGEMLDDAYISGMLEARLGALLNLERGFERGQTKSEAAKRVEEAFAQLDMVQLVEDTMTGTLFGYGPMEVLWANEGGALNPVEVVAKPPHWFLFDAEGRLRLRTRANPTTGELLPDYKFLLPRRRKSFDNPYGRGLLSTCFFPWLFKKNGFAFLATACEKFGMPWVIGKLARGADQSEYDKLAELLIDMFQDGVATVPNDASIEIKAEGTGSGTVNIHQTLIAEAKKELSVAVLGHEGAVQSTPGKLGEQDTALRVMDYITERDRRVAESTVNQLAVWWWTLNVGDKGAPSWSMWKSDDVDKALADRDAVLHTMGVRFKEAYIAREHRIPVGEFTTVETSAVPAAAALARRRAVITLARKEPGTQGDKMLERIDDAAGKISPEMLQGLSEGMLKPLWPLIQGGETDEHKLAEAFVKAYPEMDDGELEQQLANVNFVAEMLARFAAQEGKE
jgi:phage gp29-like protein